MSRPDHLIVPIRPVTPGFVSVQVLRNDLPDTTKAIMSRHQMDPDCYGRTNGSVAPSSQKNMNGLVDFLEENGITPIIEMGKIPTDDSDGHIEYISTVIVKGKEDVDKLIALSEPYKPKPAVGVQKFIGQEKGGERSK